MNVINFVTDGNLGASLINLLLNVKYVGIFIAMLLNGMTEFPSSQIMYPIVGYYASTQQLNIFIAIAAGALGNAFGNYFLFLLSIKYKDRILSKQTDETKEKVHNLVYRFSHHNKLWLVLGKLIPGVKTFIPVITAMLHINKFLAFAIFLLGSTIWATIMIALGYYFGQSVSVPGYVLIIPFIAFLIIAILVEKVLLKSLTSSNGDDKDTTLKKAAK